MHATLCVCVFSQSLNKHWSSFCNRRDGWSILGFWSRALQLLDHEDADSIQGQERESVCGRERERERISDSLLVVVIGAMGEAQRSFFCSRPDGLQSGILPFIHRKHRTECR